MFKIIAKFAVGKHNSLTRTGKKEYTQKYIKLQKDDKNWY